MSRSTATGVRSHQDIIGELWEDEHRAESAILDERKARLAEARLIIAQWKGLGFSDRAIGRGAGIDGYTVWRVQAQSFVQVTARVLDRLESLTFDAIMRSAGDHEAVPALGAVRRVRALAANGWPITELPLSKGTRHRLDDIDNPMTTCAASTWRAVAATYERLGDEIGPDIERLIVSRDRKWAPPVGWSPGTLDDPRARPWTSVRGSFPKEDIDRARHLALMEDALYLLVAMVPADTICERLEVRPHELKSVIRHNGTNDMVRLFQEAQDRQHRREPVGN